MLAAAIIVPVVLTAPPTRAPGAAGIKPAAQLSSTSTMTTIPAGSYIIDMGVSPQTYANGLKPYGLIYALMINKMVPVDWVINDNKPVDGTDFAYNGKAYKGGPFIVEAPYAAQALSTINSFRSQGVVVDGPTTGALTVPVRKTLTNWPNALLDGANGTIAQSYYVDAGIPQTITNGATGQTKTAYQFMSPTDSRFLSNCYDLYAMPHADPTYATHHPLKAFNALGGYIWAGCHAVSVMENIRDPQGNLDLNFLTSNGLIPYSNHKGITGPFTRSPVGGDPVNQYLGTTLAAQTNGSEQIYLPNKGSAWNPDTTILESDPHQADVLSGASPGPAAADIYGRGFGSTNNGRVMYQSGHSLDQKNADAVAAIRAFLNFNLLAGIERGLSVTTNVANSVVTNSTVPVSATISGGATNYSYQWVSSCGGTFDNPTGSITRSGASVTVTANFTAPAGAQGCSIKLSVADSCGRTSFASSVTTVVGLADLSISKTDGLTALQAGMPDTYTVTVTNKGPGTADPVTVTDPWPGQFLIFGNAAPSQGACSFDGTTVSCALGSIPPGGTATITIKSTARPDAQGTINNTATVSAPQRDTNPGDNTATDTTVVAPNGLHLTKTADPSSADLSSVSSAPVTFTFTVTDTGPDALSNVSVTDTDLPGCTPTYQSGDADADQVLQPSETWVYTCTVPVSSDVHNHATATATDPLIGPVNASAEATVNAIAPGISVDKGVDGQVATAGGEVVFTVVVKNTGDTVLTDVATTDSSTPACNRYLGTLAVGATISYSCSLNPAPAAGTSAVNTISVTGTSPSGSQVSGTDNSPYSTVNRDLSITKNPVDCATGAALTGPAYYPGDQVCYQLVAKNNGTAPQTNISLQDTLPTGISNPTTNWTTSTAQIQKTIINDTFDSNVNTATAKAWDNGWVEVNETTDKTGGNVRLGDVNTTDTNGTATCTAASPAPHNCLVFIKQNTGIAYPTTLSSYNSCTLTFDWRVVQAGNGGGDTGLTIHVGYTTSNAGNYTTNWHDVTTIPAAPGVVSTPGPWNTATVPLTGAALSTGIAFGARALGDGNDRWDFDNASIVCSTPYSPSGTTTSSPTIIAPAQGVNLYPGQTLTAIVKAGVTSAGGTFPRELVNVAGIGSDQQATPSQAAATVSRVVAGIQLVKKANPTVIEPGDPVTYTFTVTDTGNDPLAGVSITDTQVPGCTPTQTGGDTNGNGILDLTETWTYSCTVTLSAALSNTATASGTSTTNSSAPNGPGNGTPLQTVSGTGTARVDMVKSGIQVVKKADQSVVRPGTPVTYTYDVTLAPGDTEPLTGVYLTDDHCSPIQGPTYSGGNSDGTLEAGETWHYTCAQPLSSTTTNTVTAHGVDRLGTGVTGTDKATVTVINPSIAIDKTASPTTVSPGQTVTYTMKVTNPGDAPLSSISVTDSQCSSLTFVGGDNGDQILQPGEVWIYQCSETLTADTTNTASVTGTDALGGAVTASARAAVDVQSPSIQLVKSADKALVFPGTPVTYTIIAINNGDLPLSSVTVSDNTCSPLDGPHTATATGPAPAGQLAPGDKWFYTCTATISGTTTNTATVSADAQNPTGGTTTVTDRAQAFVRSHNPLIQVTKVPNQSKVAPGTPVTYTYNVANNTACAATDEFCLDDNEIHSITISDNKCSPVNPVNGINGANIGDTGRPDGEGVADGVLDVGETWQFTCTVAVNAPTTNTVTVSGLDVQDAPIGPVTATAFVDTTSSPTLAVVKSGPVSADVGATVTYTFRVTNTTDCSAAPDPPSCTANSWIVNPVLSDDVTGTPTYGSGDTNANGRLDVGETWVYTSTYTVKESDLANGVTNHVTVTGTDRDGDTVGPATDSHHLDVVASPALSLDKQAGTPSGSTAGSTIPYRFVVTNTGNVTLTSVTVDDPKVGSVNCPSTMLAPGASTTCTATYTITQADVDTGHVVNTATSSASGPGGGPVTSNQDTTDTPLAASPAITLAKRAGTPSGDAAGSTIGYTFTVTNTGNMTLTGVSVSDAKVGAVDCPATALAPGGSTICTATYTLTQADVDAGMVDNTATVSGRSPMGDLVTSGPSSTHTPIPASPSLVLDKQAGTPSGDTAGSTIVYTFTVTNTGNVTMSLIAIADAKVGTADCPIPMLLPGDATVCTATYTITQADVDAGHTANVAHAVATAPNGDTVASNDDSTDTPLAPGPAVSIIKKAGTPSGTTAGSTIAYTFTVTNTGNVTLTGVSVSDPKVGTVDCASTTLAPGGSTACAATYTLTQADIDAGHVANTATASAITPGGGSAMSGPSATDTPLAAAPAISLLKKAGTPSGSAAGSTIGYTFTVTNTGNVTLTGVSVSDPKVGAVVCPSMALAPAASEDCAATYTLTQADVDGGAVDNTATVSGTPPVGPAISSAPSSTDTPIPAAPAIQLMKKTGPVSGSTAGSTIAYLFTVTNTGNVTLTSVTVNDAKVGPADCPSTTLVPGESITCTATYTITQADVDAGKGQVLLNVATPREIWTLAGHRTVRRVLGR